MKGILREGESGKFGRVINPRSDYKQKLKEKLENGDAAHFRKLSVYHFGSAS
jgi:hypothetical protein